MNGTAHSLNVLLALTALSPVTHGPDWLWWARMRPCGWNRLSHAWILALQVVTIKVCALVLRLQ